MSFSRLSIYLINKYVPNQCIYLFIYLHLTSQKFTSLFVQFSLFFCFSFHFLQNGGCELKIKTILQDLFEAPSNFHVCVISILYNLPCTLFGYYYWVNISLLGYLSFFPLFYSLYCCGIFVVKIILNKLFFPLFHYLVRLKMKWVSIYWIIQITDLTTQAMLIELVF